MPNSSNSDINNPISHGLITTAMQNQDFMEFAELEGGERIKQDIEAFFTDYSELSINEQLDNLKNPTLVRMWRFFVAYMLDLEPYSLATSHLIQTDLCAKWITTPLSNLVTSKYLTRLALLDKANNQTLHIAN
ncbi:hypothetical protein [Marinomonas posidonica]|uniref:hypothetical protein n=1 Tax=Marinomonas posidonica TaxID=936476 RepID=UPI003736AB38